MRAAKVGQGSDSTGGVLCGNRRALLRLRNFVFFGRMRRQPVRRKRVGLKNTQQDIMGGEGRRREPWEGGVGFLNDTMRSVSGPTGKLPSLLIGWVGENERI